jgi:hypothetical protein
MFIALCVCGRACVRAYKSTCAPTCIVYETTRRISPKFVLGGGVYINVGKIKNALAVTTGTLGEPLDMPQSSE